MVLPKTKKILLLALLLIISITLGLLRFFAGSNKIAKAQSQCWVAPLGGDCTKCDECGGPCGDCCDGSCDEC